MTIRKCNKGFTLVELSIVLVIIGLIVGGVVGGQALIKSARSQTLVRELTTIQTGWNTFGLQYDAIPGDITEATDYWGNSTSNGDGNNTINATEAILVWQHLSLSRIIPETYSGNSLTTNWTLNENIPESAIGNSGWVFSTNHYMV
jgi:prepilin-type N-terminal cleavage/methylation domain-containing protein